MNYTFRFNVLVCVNSNLKIIGLLSEVVTLHQTLELKNFFAGRIINRLLCVSAINVIHQYCQREVYFHETFF